MRVLKRVYVTPYTSKPMRLTGGDIISCRDFSRGFKLTNGLILVGWRDDDGAYRKYLAESGQGVFFDDPSRASARFLVTEVVLEQGDGPDDMCPGEHRSGRSVKGVRIDEQGIMLDEEISFSLDEPMSLVRPQEECIEIVGYVTLPVRWEDSE